jgi:hypothetical protein
VAELPNPGEGVLLTHFIVAEDVARSRAFYSNVLGGETVREGEPSIDGHLIEVGQTTEAQPD